MTDVASRELRNNTRSLLDRVAAGETITITVDGRPVAQLVPFPDRPAHLSGTALAEALDNQADAGLSSWLRDLSPDSTDDLDP